MAIAKAECTCAACGKKFEVRVSRSNSREAASFEAWAVENITECKDCEKARLNARHEAENAAAMEAAREMGYPELIGTEKQIAWASSIRKKALHYYITDGGHCLMAVPRPLLEQALEKGCDMYEVPLPVRYVLEKGWDEISGTDSICVDVPYHDMMGALVPDGYEEF